MKTLVVKYLPRLPRSHTARLLERFMADIDGNGEVEILDLIRNPPPYFDEASIDAYVRRDYLGQELSASDTERLKPFDDLTQQFIGADVVAMAFPMHNFSMPGLVKSYFDSVMLKRHTWTSDAGRYQGMMQGKKAITMSAAGGIYLEPPNPWDHLTTLVKVEFQFMGFSDIQPVLAEGMNVSEDHKNSSLKRCYSQIQNIVDEWYSSATRSTS